MSRLLMSLACLAIAWVIDTVPADGDLVFHVSKTGGDHQSGSQQSPFLTLKRAQTAVRQEIKKGLRSNITIIVHGGVYELSTPWGFDEQDSGTNAHYIKYIASKGERVVVSGGRQIKNWAVSTENLCTTHLPSVKQGRWFFRQLIVQAQRMQRARWPNADGLLHITEVDETTTQFSLDHTIASPNLAGQDTELVVYQNWSVTRGRVMKSRSNQLTTATAMGWIGHGPATTASPGKTAFLEHGRDFLDQPGEWFLDRKKGELHYLPKPGERPDTLHVVAPVLDQLLQINGTPATPVRNLHFEGIRFRDCRFELPSIGYNEIQAAHYGTTLRATTFVQPVAIECNFAHECSFVDCQFTHLNNSGIGLGQGCRGNRIDRCTIEQIGGTGVMVGWRGKGKLSGGKEGKLDADWADIAQAPQLNIISNCVIRDCGCDSFGGVGIFVAFSRSTQVRNNALSNLPYTGISIGYRWDSTDTSQTGCLVDSNHIFNVTTKLADGGGIYTLGRQPGTVIRGNHIHDVQRSDFTHGGAPNNGIFIDQGSEDFLFDSNVIHTTSGEPIRFNISQEEAHQWKTNWFGDTKSQALAAQKIIQQAGVQELQPNEPQIDDLGPRRLPK